MDMAQILWGVLFGAIGAGFMVYGRKQGALAPLLCGLALVVFPYFVTNTVLLVLIGVALVAAPYFFR